MRRLLCTVATLVALATGCATAQEPPASTAPVPAPTATRTAPVPADVPAAPRLAPRTPTRLHVADVSAQVVPLSLAGGALVPPPDPALLGWWGRRAAARHGVTLLVGHTVRRANWTTYGRGALNDLEHLPTGSTATVSGVRYTVTSNRTISKAALARQAPRLFSQQGPHRLVLVTCEDYDPDTGHYRSNVVVTAEPQEVG